MVQDSQSHREKKPFWRSELLEQTESATDHISRKFKSEPLGPAQRAHLGSYGWGKAFNTSIK